AKTEQLRSIMLREAFEQEQNRVGLSLGQAEAYVHDQAMETEATRRVEAEEMQVSRQHVATLNQIHAAKADACRPCRLSRSGPGLGTVDMQHKDRLRASGCGRVWKVFRRPRAAEPLQQPTRDHDRKQRFLAPEA
ncbi:unnamed protein product, partial [Symbiodinium sp. CCMP2456]